ncbi:MAG: hypothetical protein RTU63_14810 [Candidatus Thorarchaeota archaeon]
MRDSGEFDDDMEDMKLFSSEDAKEILQEIEEELLSKSERDELVREYNREFDAERRKTRSSPVETDSSEIGKKYPVNMWVPEIDGDPIETYDHLLETVESRSPGFFERADAPKLLKSAQLHINLYQEYHEREFLKQGEVAELSRELEKSPTTLKRYLREGVMPKMYYWLNMVPSDERERKLEVLIPRLNGVTTNEEYDRRFNSLYFHEEMSTTQDHEQYDEFARKFLTFIDEYQDSGLLSDIAKRLGIGKSTIGAWFDGTQLPTRIAYASLIPQEEPSPGFKWLPMKLNNITNLPEEFIQVPLEIDSSQDILDVLDQLSPLDTKAMKTYEKDLGDMSQENAFMYLLGIMVSDGAFKCDVDYSAAANLFVSKKYPWGEILGSGFCYTLGKIGLSAKRSADNEKIKENGKLVVCRVYDSTASPLLMWMKMALLGIKDSENKKNVPIKADWILNVPYDWRVAFIQGLADGDGYASIPRFDTAITTTTNKEFFVELLASVGIKSTNADHRAKIAKYDEILKARELPLFRYAIGRQKILADMCRIIELRPGRRYRVPEKEKQLVQELYDSGLSAGQITERLWYDYGMARPTSTIERLISLENKKKIRNADSDN